MVGGCFFFFCFFIAQASSQILTVSHRERLLNLMLFSSHIHLWHRGGETKKQNLCTPSIIPKKEVWPQNSLDSWCTLGGDGTGFAYRSSVATPCRLSRSSSSANLSPSCSVIFPLFLSLYDSYSLHLKI